MADLLLSAELPNDLLPYKGRLTPRFFEAREQIVKFIREDVLPVRPEWHRQRAVPTSCAALPLQRSGMPLQLSTAFSAGA